jgi:hypothetical protein
MLADTKIKRITTGTDSIALQDWLANYIGTGNGSDGTVTVIDLSLIPAEVVHKGAPVLAIHITASTNKRL